MAQPSIGRNGQVGPSSPSHAGGIRRRRWRIRGNAGQVTVEYALALLVMIAFTVGVQEIVVRSLAAIVSVAAQVLSQPYP